MRAECSTNNGGGQPAEYGLLGLQGNLAEGVWEEKVGKAQKCCCIHNARNSCFFVAQVFMSVLGGRLHYTGFNICLFIASISILMSVIHGLHNKNLNFLLGLIR